MPPNVVIGGTLGVAAAVTTGQGVEAALAVGLPAALIGSAFEVFTKTVCSFFIHSSEAYVEAQPRPNTRGIALMAHLGNGLYFLTAAIPVFIALQFGTAAAQGFFASITGAGPGGPHRHRQRSCPSSVSPSCSTCCCHGAWSRSSCSASCWPHI